MAFSSELSQLLTRVPQSPSVPSVSYGSQMTSAGSNSAALMLFLLEQQFRQKAEELARARAVMSDAGLPDVLTSSLLRTNSSPRQNPLLDNSVFVDQISKALEACLLPTGPELGLNSSLAAFGGNATANGVPSSPDVSRLSGSPPAGSKYKTELCRSWEATGTCRYGDKCQFAHGRHELQPVPRHPKYKTEVCRTFATTGTCPYGVRCRFIHYNSNLEVPGQVEQSPPTPSLLQQTAAMAPATPPPALLERTLSRTASGTPKRLPIFASIAEQPIDAALQSLSVFSE